MMLHCHSCRYGQDLRTQTAGPHLARNCAEWDEFAGSEVNDENNPGHLILDLLWYIRSHTDVLYSDYRTRSRHFYLANFASAFAIPFTIWIYIFTKQFGIDCGVMFTN
jgi:hypothetical protein